MKLSKKALELVWSSRALWFFGVFAGGIGGASTSRAPSRSLSIADHALPSWFFPVIAFGAVVAVGMLLMHLVSESALILGIRKRMQGDTFGLQRGMREGRHFMPRILGIELLTILVAVAIIAAVAVPALLYVFKILPLIAMVVIVAPLSIVAFPALLTLYMLRQWALRAAVLDDLPIRAAIAAGRREIRGRLLDGLQLMILELVAQTGGVIIGLILALPAAAIGLVVGFTAGLIPGLAVGGGLALPVILTVVGASNAFRSALWTLGFLDGKAQTV